MNWPNMNTNILIKTLSISKIKKQASRKLRTQLEKTAA